VSLGRDDGITLRLLGGVGVAAHLTAPPLLTRTYADVDLFTVGARQSHISRMMVKAGYEPDETFNAMHGRRRLLYYDIPGDRQVDVFIGDFSMCHQLPLARTFDRGDLAIWSTDLLLTKLQVFELNEKDRRDILNLLYALPVVADGGQGIDGGYVGSLCARDWGLWRTTTLNLARSAASVGDYDITPGDRKLLLRRIQRVMEFVDEAPKTARWRLRAKVGDRVRWYEEPEEVNR
jgi:hypothetical protein